MALRFILGVYRKDRSLIFEHYADMDMARSGKIYSLWLESCDLDTHIQ